MKKFARVLCIVLALALLAPAALAEDFAGTTIRLAQQYGMQYAPVYVMQQMGILQKHLPGAELTWSNLGGGSTMNEALISGSLDVAFMGIPPFVIAWDKGVSYRIAAGICVPPSELMVRKEGIESIKDFGPEDKIAVPSIGSIQHIMMSMVAERELGDAHALDNNMVAMANPDAYAALLSGTEVAAHCASMPYIDLETQQGMRSIMTAKEMFPAQASIICVATEALQSNTAVYEGLMAALKEAIEVINAQGDEVIKLIAETEKITPEQAKTYLNWEGTIYSTELYGAMTLADFMQKNGYIKKAPASVEDIAWPGIQAVE